MEFIKFIFSDFWIFLGFALLLLIFLSGIEDIVKRINQK